MSVIVNQTAANEATLEIQNLHIGNLIDDTLRSEADASNQTTSTDSAHSIYLKNILREKDNEIAFLRNQLKLEQSHNEANLEQTVLHMDNLKQEIEGWKNAFLAKSKEVEESKRELDEKNLRIEFVEEALAETSEKLEAKEKECKKIELVRDTIMNKANGRIEKTRAALEATQSRVKELEEELESTENHIDGKLQLAQAEFDKKIEELSREHATAMDELEEDKNQEIESLKFEHEKKIQEMMERHEEKVEDLEAWIKGQEKEIQELEQYVEQMDKEEENENPVYEQISDDEKENEDQEKAPTSSSKTPIRCSHCKRTTSALWRFVNGGEVKCDTCYLSWMRTAGCAAGANIKYVM